MPGGTEPPVSNALMAALKRAQAHQRKGCPEMQQQPLLAVKVELEQLIISILDDPSVSRVMREASFSSPSVKAIIEQSLNSTSSLHKYNNHHHGNVNLTNFTGISPRIPAQIPVLLPTRNIYLNPKLQQGGGVGKLVDLRNEEVKRVVDILIRTKKRNPVLVGEGEPEAVVNQFLRNVEKGELGDVGGGVLKNVQVVSVKEFLSDKNQILVKIKELEGLIESRIGTSGGVILHLGDLKWLVEQQPASFGAQQQQQQPPVVSEVGCAAVVEIGKLLERFSDGRIWLIGTATCETYLRCQVYHPTMENDWDLQAFPIASRSPHPGVFPRLGNEKFLSGSLDPLNPSKSFTTAVPALPRCMVATLNPVRRISCCPQCTEKFEQELAKLVSEFVDLPAESARPVLPQWLQNAKLNNDNKETTLSQSKDQGLLKQKTLELQRKWKDTCLQLHPSFQHNADLERTATAPPALSMSGLYNRNLFLCQSLQSKPQTSLRENLQLNTTQRASQLSELANSPPGSPVKTDLVLGQKSTKTSSEKTNEDQVKDSLGCISSEPQNKYFDKFASALDADTFKRLLKGLMEQAWWQRDAASAVASAVSRCRLGNGRRRGGALKGDIWLLFAGPDRAAKRKMATVLAQQVYGNSPGTIYLGSHQYEESDLTFRGKTVVDRIAEAVRMNPLSVLLLEDIDEADMLVRGNIKRAMDRGRLTDSHGREISLGNVIFILTGNWSTMNPESFRIEYLKDEKKLISTASSNCQLRLTVDEKSAKRRGSWSHDENRPTRRKKEMDSGLVFDLNEAAESDDYRTDGSHNSSDLTVEHEDELGIDNRQSLVTSVPHELVNSVDDSIQFKPIDFPFARREIKKTILKKFSMVVDDKVSMEIEDYTIDRILGGLLCDKTSLEQWVEKVLDPSFVQLQPHLSSLDESIVVKLQLESDAESDSQSYTEASLPSKVTVMDIVGQ